MEVNAKPIFLENLLYYFSSILILSASLEVFITFSIKAIFKGGEKADF